MPFGIVGKSPVLWGIQGFERIKQKKACAKGFLWLRSRVLEAFIVLKTWEARTEESPVPPRWIPSNGVVHESLLRKLLCRCTGAARAGSRGGCNFTEMYVQNRINLRILEVADLALKLLYCVREVHA
jgi:hypothetical protein